MHPSTLRLAVFASSTSSTTRWPKVSDGESFGIEGVFDHRHD
jgi:hypothetical protein